MNEIFRIHKVTPIEVDKIAASENEPHSHDYEELMIGIEGILEHFIDFKTTLMEAPFVSFVARNKIHKVVPKVKDGKCQIWAIRFKSEFIPETTFQLYSLYHNRANIELRKDRCFSRLETLCNLMDEEARQNNPDYGIVRHLLSALFTMIEAERKKNEPDEELQKTENITFKNFLKILEENFRRSESVDFYAEKLFMTSRNLNIICQNILQQSVSEIVETRKLIEAKNLLVSTNMSISEIGFELGYKEKSHFTNVFKKKSGQTPSDFRKEIKTLIS